jgi:hypothetical protein
MLIILFIYTSIEDSTLNFDHSRSAEFRELTRWNSNLRKDGASGWILIVGQGLTR